MTTREQYNEHYRNCRAKPNQYSPPTRDKIRKAARDSYSSRSDDVICSIAHKVRTEWWWDGTSYGFQRRQVRRTSRLVYGKYQE